MYGDFVKPEAEAELNLWTKLGQMAWKMLKKVRVQYTKCSDIDLGDPVKVIMLLTSLPSSFAHFVVAMQTRDELPSFGIVKSKLLDEAERQDQCRKDRERWYKGVCSTYERSKSNKLKEK